MLVFLFFFFLVLCFGKMSICLYDYTRVCMYIGFTEITNKKTSQSQKKPRIWDFNSLTAAVLQGLGMWQILGYCCLAVNESYTRKLYSDSVSKQRNALHIWRLGMLLAILDLSPFQCAVLTPLNAWPVSDLEFHNRLMLTNHSCATLQTGRSFQKLGSTGGKDW